MAADSNRLNALASIQSVLLQDAVAVARQHQLDTPPSWPALPDRRGVDAAGFRQLLAMDSTRPDHPLNWQRQAAAEELIKPRVRLMYFLIKRHLWLWPEFASLSEKARLILNIVIELARDEAFPWHLNVQSRQIMKLARLNHASHAICMRQLECLTVTRLAQRVLLFNPERADHKIARLRLRPRFPSAANSYGTDPTALGGGFGLGNAGAEPDTATGESKQPIPQWVVRYRRGLPRSKSRAAWWINYDLLCGTGRVLPCFEFTIDNLPKPYLNRNERMGVQPEYRTEEGFAAVVRSLAQKGPLPSPGFRSVLWEGMDFEG